KVAPLHNRRGSDSLGLQQFHYRKKICGQSLILVQSVAGPQSEPSHRNSSVWRASTGSSCTPAPPKPARSTQDTPTLRMSVRIFFELSMRMSPVTSPIKPPLGALHFALNEEVEPS